ncbi:hypothetical protein C8R46DRAFT_1043779 [Mycena filopes]|nr:hypothetical protein C8R46DRAFT_1043779 [Mycena filopes]
MTNFIQLVPVPSPGQFSSSQTTGSPVLTGPQNSQAAHDQPAADNALPLRPTCPMPYFPEADVDRDEHSGASNHKFYVCIPARVQGTFTDEQRALTLVTGWRNGKAQSVQTYADALTEWALGCRRWHGPVCADARGRAPRVVLTHGLPQEQWAVKGVSQLFPSRHHAFAAAEALNLKKVHIMGSRNEVLLEAWQYDE